jgi:hypothetical protein
MPGRARTPLTLLSNTAGGRAPSAPQVAQAEGEIPPFPLADTGDRRAARDFWAQLWRSSVARLIDPVADAYALQRWMQDIDEFERLSYYCSASPVVKAGSGPPRLNPLYARVAQLSRALAEWEERFGITPRGRQYLRVPPGDDPAQAVWAMLREPFEEDADGGLA